MLGSGNTCTLWTTPRSHPAPHLAPSHSGVRTLYAPVPTGNTRDQPARQHAGYHDTSSIKRAIRVQAYALAHEMRPCAGANSDSASVRTPSVPLAKAGVPPCPWPLGQPASLLKMLERPTRSISWVDHAFSSCGVHTHFVHFFTQHCMAYSSLYRDQVSILGPRGYEPRTLPLRHLD